MRRGEGHDVIYRDRRKGGQARSSQELCGGFTLQDINTAQAGTDHYGRKIVAKSDFKNVE